MWFVPFSWSAVVAGFILFRFFDIIKPWPIKWIDQHVEGGLGIMLDDVLAGIMAGGLLLLIEPYIK
jgi:phosphatidylglycerophosphatase A